MISRVSHRPSPGHGPGPYAPRHPRPTLALVVLGLVVAASTALACRYSVRDTGFVDLGAEPYQLRLQLPPNAPATLTSHFTEAAAAVLLDANLAFSVVPHPDANSNAAAAQLRLTSPDQRELTLAASIDPRLPRAEIVALLERAVSSPARTRLHDELLRAYAVLIFVEGRDAAANRRARATADAAVAAITKLLPQMPKPVEVPPRLLTLPVRSIPEESVLLWGLGMNAVPTEDPRVAVVFGRGRRVGEPLEGGLITQTVLQDRLALIGQDCECDLDRSSLQGPVIPARWDASRQRAAATALGFDPENPLIRAEISRIVLKGPARPAGSRTTPNAFDALSLGYSEDPVSASGSADAEPVTNTDSDSDPTDARAGGTRPLSAAEVSPPPATAAVAVLHRGTLASWFALSGLSLVVAVAGTWLLVRARKNRS